MNKDKLKAKVQKLVEDPTTKEVLERIDTDSEVNDFRAQTREEKIGELLVELKTDNELVKWKKFLGVKGGKVKENISKRVKAKELEKVRDRDSRLQSIKELELARRARRRGGKI